MALRRWTRRNKNELIVLTGAVYAFVSYLTAFTLEILFLLDLAKPNSDAITLFNNNDNNIIQSNHNNSIGSDDGSFMDRFNFESIQTHLAVSCLAIAVLYFLIFIASLKLIVALILRSTFVILIWMCLMTTLYLPEFGLVIYVSVYCWGLQTRNGQTELIFYLFRAILNVLFILSARKLFKEWSFEKTFLRLKSTTNGYDSPYFISGMTDCRGANLSGFNRGGFLGCRNDSLSTTINPLFSSSTLNLSSYDQMANSSQSEMSPTSNYYTQQGGFGYSNGSNTNDAQEWTLSANNLWRLSPKDARSIYNHQHTRSPLRSDGYVNYNYNNGNELSLQQQQSRQRADRSSRTTNRPISGRSPDLDDDDGDNLTSCELDLEYRTLSHCRRSINGDADERMSTTCLAKQSSSDQIQGTDQQQQYNQPNQRLNAHHRHQQQLSRESNHNLDDNYVDGGTMTSSTQSLDRRYLRSHFAHHQHHHPPQPASNPPAMHDPEQVILRPLRHRPFDYLHRPGSSSNLNNQA